MPTVALTVTAVGGAMLVLIAAAVLIHPSTHLAGFLAATGDQNQGVKTTLYLLAFLVVLPGSVYLVPRLVDRLLESPNRAGLGALAGLLLGALMLAVILARVSARLPWGDDVAVVLTAGCCWWAVTALVLARALSAKPWPALLRAAPLAPVLAGGAAVSALGAVLCVTSLSRLSAVALLLGAIVLLVVVALHGRARLPRVSGRLAVALELLIVVLLVLVIPDLNIFKPAATRALTSFNASVIGDQENFLLGPANQLLAGGTMLVDTVSQYGVVSIDFLAGWFHIAPIGYGTIGFLDGVLTALMYLGGYWVLRMGGLSRLLATSAVALGVIVLLYNMTYPLGSLAEHGPFRFGLPMAAILAVMVGLRFPRWARFGRWSACVVLAVASVWSIEAFAYTSFTLAVMAVVYDLQRPPGRRMRWLATQALRAAVSVIVAQAGFALATLLAAGQLPDWGSYLTYFKSFESGSVAYLTYGFARWSPGLAVAALYLASAAAIALVLWRAPAVFRRHVRTLVALSGVTAYGIAVYSYFDNRSSTYLLLYVALPALLTGALWLSLMLRLTAEAPRRVGRAVLSCALALALITLAAAWSPISGRFSDSALAYIAPGGPSLSGALNRLWHPPPVDPRALPAEHLMARYMPGERRSLIFTLSSADLGTEILIRSRRGNRLPLGDPIEDSIVPTEPLPAMRAVLEGLRPGERMLLDSAAESYVRSLGPGRWPDPLRGAYAAAGSNRGAADLEEWALQRIVRRFRLRTVVARQGFVVAVLQPLAQG